MVLVHVRQRSWRRNKHWNAPFASYGLWVHGKEGRTGPRINNQFGCEEYLHLCELLNVEPYINVNYGFGTPQEAAEWVEF